MSDLGRSRQRNERDVCNLCMPSRLACTSQSTPQLYDRYADEDMRCRHHHKVEPASHGATDQTKLSKEEVKDHNKELQHMQVVL